MRTPEAAADKIPARKNTDEIIEPASFAAGQGRAGIFGWRQARRTFGRNVLGTSGMVRMD
jgi:hypothetical protein